MFRLYYLSALDTNVLINFKLNRENETKYYVQPIKKYR